MKNTEPKITIQGVKFENLPYEANIAPVMQELVYTAKQKSLSHNAIKIILLLSANLKDKQIKKRQYAQLDLFDDEWFDVNNTKDINVQLNFKFSDFLPKGNKNYKQVKDGIDELQRFNQTIDFSKEDKNGKIRNYKLKSAFISSYIVEEGYGFKMTINNYWYRALINITDRYNKYIKSIVFNLNFNSLTFYFYLKSLDHINAKEYEDLLKKVGGIGKKHTGTIMKIETLLKKFDSKLKFESDIKRKLLDPIRNDLNKWSDISFNYLIEDGKVKIVTYELDKIKIADEVLNVETSRIRAAINYKVKKYDLTAVDAQMLIEMYIKYTYDIVLKATNKKRILMPLKGSDYMIAFSTLIGEFILKNGIDLKEIQYTNIQELRKELRELMKGK